MNHRTNRQKTRRLKLESLESRRLLATLIVNSLGDNLTGGDGLVTLREAIDAANNDSITDLGQTGSGADTIQFSGAAATGTITLSLGQLIVNSALTIAGPGQEDLIIDAHGNSRIMSVSGINSVTIEDLTITGGQAPDGEHGGAIVSTTSGTLETSRVTLIHNTATHGGAVFASDGMLRLMSGTKLQENVALADGGAVYVSSSLSTALAGVMLVGNTAQQGSGGALYSDGSSLAVNSATIHDNVADDDGGALRVNNADITVNGSSTMISNAAGGNGGAIRISGGNLNALVDINAVGNRAAGVGGAIHISGGDLSLNFNTLTGNQSGSKGGAIFALANSVTIISSEISGNTADNDGGGIYSRSDSLDITRTTIAENETTDLGGGILAFIDPSGSATITTSTISGNTAKNGGGLHAAQTGPTTAYLLEIVGTTITKNISNEGGGIDLGLRANIKSSIIADNSGQISSPDLRSSQPFTLTNSLIGNNNGTSLSEDQPPVPDIDGNFIGSNTNPIDPRLSRLGKNSADNRTHALLFDSPAIDHGNAHGETLDQTGRSREFDSGTADMGAYELGRFYVVNSTANTPDDNPGDGLCQATITTCTLAAAIEEANAVGDLDGHPDTIYFDISGSGVHTISPTSGLPLITGTVIIDATSEDDYDDIPRIQIDGGGTIADGLAFDTSHSVVRGLSVTGFTDAGIEVVDTSSGVANVIEANHLGLDPSGAAAGNFHGIRVQGATSTLIDANVISGNNRAGIFVNDGDFTNIVNNRIGTDPNGLSARPNATDGITNFGRASVIGLPGQGNIISGNARWGVFTRFADRSDVTIRGNLIGTDFSGANPLPNVIGVYLQNGPNIVGGAGTSANVISGNSAYGVAVAFTTGNQNQVFGNAIGTDLSGTIDVGNGLFGVRITQGSDNRIGSRSQQQGNLISGNGTGILMVFPEATGNEVVGNRIGTNLTGTGALGNSSNGIRLAQGTSDNVIRDNLISGNGGRAVSTDGATTSGNDILFNLIGTSAAGNSPLHNGTGGALRLRAPNSRVEGNVISSADHGILAFGSAANLDIIDNYFGTNENETSTTLGMDQAIRIILGSDNNLIQGNVIANNNKGVVVVNGTGNAIRDNSIYNNAVIGIDLGDNGATGNDAGDADTGANNLQNAPELSEASLALNHLTVTYKVRSNATQSAYPLTIEFFISDGNGQGKTLMGTNVYVQAERNTDKTIVLDVTGLAVNLGDTIVGTATDSLGNTSEFGVEFTVV